MRALGRRDATSGPTVHKITAARPSLSDDIRSRQFRYLVSMSIRTACFVLAIVTSGPLRWVFFAGAVVLPYVAVVLANAGRPTAEPIPLVPPVARGEIGPGPSTNAPAA